MGYYDVQELSLNDKIIATTGAISNVETPLNLNGGIAIHTKDSGANNDPRVLTSGIYSDAKALSLSTVNIPSPLEYLEIEDLKECKKRIEMAKRLFSISGAAKTNADDINKFVLFPLEMLPCFSYGQLLPVFLLNGGLEIRI